MRDSRDDTILPDRPRDSAGRSLANVRRGWLRVALVGGLLGSAPSPAGEPSPVAQHSGMCDASAVVAVGDSLFVAANDEDNALRVYPRDTSGPPLSEHDLSAFLAVDSTHPEADIEGAARLGSRVYWTTSHGRNKDGKIRDSRQRFFATTVHSHGDRVEIRPVGTAYRLLNDDLVRDARLRALGLPDAIGPGRSKAAELAPWSRGINIEALAGTPDGKGVLLGFRNPRPGGKALVVPLTNPDEVVSGTARARFADPILLDLDGLGVRDLAVVSPPAGYLILAGPHDGGGPFRLYGWSGDARAAPKRLRDLEASTCSPEGLAPVGDGLVLLVRDCGERSVHGRPCKAIETKSRRTFESLVGTY